MPRRHKRRWTPHWLESRRWRGICRDHQGDCYQPMRRSKLSSRGPDRAGFPDQNNSAGATWLQILDVSGSGAFADAPVERDTLVSQRDVYGERSVGASAHRFSG